jgi:hypothetical protein
MTDYKAKAKKMSLYEIDYALCDLRETMLIWRDLPMTDAYQCKLYAEFDAYTSEKSLRLRLERL